MFWALLNWHAYYCQNFLLGQGTSGQGRTWKSEEIQSWLISLILSVIKSYTDWSSLAKGSCWIFIEKKPTKHEKELSTYVADSIEYYVLVPDKKITKCIICYKSHQLDNYPSFMKNNFKEQISFLAKKLCYALLQPMKRGHNAKTWSKTSLHKLISCEEGHPTAIHGYIPQEKFKANGSSRQTGAKQFQQLCSTDSSHTTGEFRY